MAILKFTVDSALLNELGEKLVETVHIALVELVKNSYDADATNVTVKFIDDASGASELHIIDNGIGMNFDEVDNYWMRIATTNKANNNISQQFGRPKTGSKGIGRFCCRRLGRKLELITIGKQGKEYQKTVVTFPWDQFVAGKEVTQVECPGERSTLDRGATGTTLIISNFTDEWSTRGYNFLKRQLAVLVANRGTRREGFKEDPGFSITLEAPQFEGEVRDLRNDLINAGWGTIKGYVNKKGQAVCELDALGVGRRTITSAQTFPNLADVSLKVGILVDSKDQMKDPSVLSLGTLRQILPEWGGVQIKYRGFRVYPYGDDDWLDIDRDRGLRRTAAKDELFAFAQTLKGVDPGRALLNLLSMRNYVGSVDIGTNAKGFEMKASREGFLESQAVKELQAFVRFTINWSTIYREYYIRSKSKAETETAQQYFEEVLNEKVQTGQLVKSAVSYLQKEAKNIVTLLPRKERKIFEKSVFAATDAILQHEKSNQQELHHLRLIASTSTLLLIFSHEVKSLLGLLENSKTSLGVVERKLSGQERHLVKKLREDLEEMKIRFDELLGMTALIGVDSKNAKPSKLALYEKLKKAEKAFRLIISSYDIKLNYDGVPKNIIIEMLEAELYAILLNVLSNAIKSVIAAGREKKIEVTAERSRGKTIIRVKDSGLGINEKYYEDVFLPFIADPDGRLYKQLDRKLNPEDKYIVGTGSGLGLSIVKEIVQVRNGSIAFRTPADNWKTELEIILP